jgi:hypothetical protein
VLIKLLTDVRAIKWVKYVGRMEQMRNEYKNLLGKTERMRPLG